MKTIDVVGIGNALVDQEFEVSEDFLKKHDLKKGMMELIDEDAQNTLIAELSQLGELKKQSGGGSAANSLVAFAQFGGKAYYCCKVADDEAGMFYRQDLEKIGIETSLHQQKNPADEHQKALQLIEEALRYCPEQCQRQNGGYLKIAHKPSAVEPLKQQYEQLKQFDQPVEWLTQSELSKIIASPQAHAALRFTDCFALNPMLLAAATARRAAAAGAQLVQHCPVIQAVSLGSKGVYLKTAKGAVRARKLLVCSNGYTSGQLLPELASRSLPVLSSIITTPPLSKEQVASVKLSPQYAIMDTRILKYYFRLLPDNRLLFGGRGAIQGKHASDAVYAKRLLQALHQTFPQLQDVNKWEHFWSGWVSVSLDDYPRVGKVKDNIYASMGYCGAGVSFTALAGQRLAEAAMEQPLPGLPYYQSQLKPFPFPRFRRLGQWLYYHYGRLRD